MNITDKKNTVFCLNSENGLTCSFNKRIDHFNEDLRKGILHKCNYSKKTKKCENITHFLQRLADGEQLDIEPNILLDTLVETTGKLNISLESGRSEELYELIQVAVAFGASIVFNDKNTTSFEEMFPRPSRDEFRRRFISLAFEKWREEIKKFSRLKYCCLAVDAGTTRRTSYLDFVLHHSVMGYSYIFHTLKMNGTGNAKNYCDALSKGILMAAKSKCTPSTIIVDGQSGQNKALTKGDPESIYALRYANDASEHIKRSYKVMKQIIKVPCLCHRVSNAYKSAILTNRDINNLLKKFRESANFIKSSQTIDFSSPTFIDTRWLYDFDIISYFFNKKDKINEVLLSNGKNTFSDDEYFLVYRIVEVFRALVNILSDPKTRLSSAFPLIEGASETLEEIANQSTGLRKAFALDAKKKLLAYTLNSKNGGLWFLAYSLTPTGLQDVLMRNKGRKERSTSEDFKVVSKKSIKVLEDEASDYEIKQVNDQFFDCDEMPDELDIITSNASGLIEKAVEALKYIANILDFPKTRVDNLLSSYDLFISGYITELIDNKTMDLFNWTTLVEKEELSDLADIALRLEPATCSEASAERAISCQRLIMEPRRDTAKQELRDARLIYMRTKKADSK